MFSNFTGNHCERFFLKEMTRISYIQMTPGAGNLRKIIRTQDKTVKAGIVGTQIESYFVT